jgi:hypothetical protein
LVDQVRVDGVHQPPVHLSGGIAALAASALHPGVAHKR